MAKYTAEQIGKAAKRACFYITPGGKWLRIQYCDMPEGKFMATDEDTGADTEFTFADVATEDDPHFEQLTRMVI